MKTNLSVLRFPAIFRTNPLAGDLMPPNDLDSCCGFKPEAPECQNSSLPATHVPSGVGAMTEERRERAGPFPGDG